MLETTEFDIDNRGSDCEKFISLADEYLHDELSEEEKDFIDKHLEKCEECAEYIEAERKYIKVVKTAEYIPESSVSLFVMEKIIENKMTVDKPAKKRLVPVGFISAAAVIIIMFVALRGGGAINLFMKTADNDSAKSASEFTVHGEIMNAGDMNMAMDGGILNDEDENAKEEPVESSDDVMHEQAEIAQDAFGLFMMSAPEGEDDYDDSDAGTGAGFINITYDEFLTLNSDLAIDEIYHINNSDIIKNNADIFAGIEIYKSGDGGNYFIIAKSYKDALILNLTKNNITAEDIVESGIPKANGTQNAEEYIGIIYFMN